MLSLFKEKSYSLGFKIALVVACGALLLGGGIIYFSFVNARQNALEAAIDNTQATAAASAGKVRADVEEALTVARNLSHILASYAIRNEQARQDSLQRAVSRYEVSEMLKHVLMRQDFFLAVYTLWEPDAFDNEDKNYISRFKDNDETGRFIPYWFRRGNEIQVEPLVDYMEAGPGDYYQIPKSTRKEAIIDPYKYPVSGKEVLLISAVAPVLKPSGDFLGIAGVDIQLGWIQHYLDQQSFMDGEGKMSIISTNGTLAGVQGHPELNGQTCTALFGDLDKQLLNLKEPVHFIAADTLYAAIPVVFGKSDKAWTVVLQVPVSKILQESQEQLWLSILIESTVLAFFTGLLVWLINRMLYPLKRITQSASNLAEGNLRYEPAPSGIKEIKELDQSFSALVEAQKDVTGVCQSVAEGDLSKMAQVKSDEDALALAVNKMTENLRKAATEEERRSRFNNSMQQLRDALHMDASLQAISDRFLSKVCRTLQVQQAYLYMVHRPENSTETGQHTHLELTAAYAFDRKKFLKRELLPGEGLVGQCYMEKAPAYLEHLPDDFSYIDTAVGQLRPKAVFIIPLVYNEDIHGVLEVSALDCINEVSREVLEKISEQLASVIFLMKSRQRTEVLLKKSVEQAEIMQAQEEELRQSLEEMSATQEEIKRREKENSARNKESLLILDTVNKTPALIARCRNDESYSLLFINQYGTTLTGYTEEEIKEKGFAALIHPDDLEEVNHKVDEQLQHSNCYEVNYRLVQKSGEEIKIWEYGHENHFNGEQFLDFFIIKLEEARTLKKLDAVP